MNPDPLAWNPFAVLGLPEWPDLDDETVHAAWQVIAAETHPDRPDGGNLARFTQATAAYAELCCPWGRSEAYADLLEAAWAEGRYDYYPPGHDPGDELPPAELGPVPLPEVLHLLAEIPARFRRGHPVPLADPRRRHRRAVRGPADPVPRPARGPLLCRGADRDLPDIRPGGYGTPGPAGPQAAPAGKN